MKDLLSALAALLRRELRLTRRRRAEGLQPLFFYLLIVTLFALGAEPNSPLLRHFAPDLLWVGALLAGLLGLERIFRDDYEDGTLAQWYVSRQPPAALVLVKLLAHWATSGLPLALLAPLFGLMLGLPATTMPALWTGLLLGTLGLALVGGFAAALTVALPRAGLLLPLLVLPLICPIIIFGAGAARSAAQGLEATAPLYFLAALLVLFLTLIPLAGAAALRNAFE